MARISKPSSWLRRMFTCFKYRDYRLIWTASVVEHVGEFMEVVALGWLMLELTDSALSVSLVFSFRYLPLLAFFVLGGAAADRVDRRKLLIGTLLMAAALSLLLALSIFLGAVAPWQILTMAVLGGVLTCFNHPARASIIPNIVERQDLMNAISLDSLSVNGTRLFGASIGGILISLIGVNIVFVVRAVGLLVSVAVLIPMKVPASLGPTSRRPGWQDMWRGFGYVWNYKLILSLVSMYLVLFVFARPISGLLPVFARDIMGVGASGLGFLEGSMGVGALVGLISLAYLGNYRGKGKLILGSGLIMGVCLILFSVSSNASGSFAFALVLLTILGASTSVYLTSINASVQSVVSDEFRGRVMSIREFAMGFVLVGGVVVGVLAERLGAPLAVALAGASCVAVSVAVAASLATIRNLE